MLIFQSKPSFALDTRTIELKKTVLLFSWVFCKKPELELFELIQLIEMTFILEIIDLGDRIL